MKKLLTYTMIWVAYAIHTNMYSQNSLYPEHQSQVFNHIQTLNPAISNLEGQSNILLSYQGYLGAFDKVNNKLFFSNFNLNRNDSASSRHNIGLKFNGEEEGDFISRNKFYFSYGWHIRISQKHWLGAGSNIGFAGYTYSGNSGNTQGSAMAPDGDFGLVFYNPKNWVAGLSMNQAFNTIIQPKDLAFRWKRHYNIYIQKYFLLNHSWTNCIYVQKIFRTDTYRILDLGTYLSFRNHLLFGGNVTLGTRVSAMAGFQNIPVKFGNFTLLFNYNFPLINQRRTNIQAFELSLKYQFKLKKDSNVE